MTKIFETCSAFILGLSLQICITDSCMEIDLDVNKIVRAFQNLFDNAKKYAKEGSNVIIAGETAGDTFIVQMKNQIKGHDFLQEDK